ncbi:tetratricopeptide repeat protein [Hymenobacter guriensis]|uniref:Tol-pal system protein YbgF n=1 Tax=Hymenobacter guriensis TaxID=2793065 RepID=A0ABS0L228_9BACT|nr:tol-pal system protein YbgF [Hymenobacter guriensis]MBG8554133.1 tol-pal system protein YbgF [Hymenobacter guriensis]
MHRYFLVLLLLGLGCPLAAWAQQPDTTQRQQPIRNIELGGVEVAPSAVDTKGWLLLDKDIQVELGGAVENLYNFKFDKAERQFRSLRRRYPNHPMPYFLLGLSTCWKMMPSNFQDKQYDKLMLAYLDTAIVHGERLYEDDSKNYEASFFLAASYGFAARLHAERKNWRKATLNSKEALDYLDKSKEANGLSADFLFGQGLINYYAVWISENYPLLRPVLLFFPKGNRQLGMQQLRTVARNGFYTSTEAKFFLMRLLYTEEKNPKASLQVARELATNYPDNAYFQRYYALVCYNQGEFVECQRVSKQILDKLNRGLPGYEAISGRYASFFLGYIAQFMERDLPAAQNYYQRSVVFAETTGETESGFYLLANAYLARMAAKDGDKKAARNYYLVLRENAEHRSDLYREAQAYLKGNKK